MERNLIAQIHANKPFSERNHAAMHAPEVRDWQIAHAKSAEGDKDAVYLDPKGVPTMANGHAMGDIDATGTVRIYSRKDVNTDLARAGMPQMSEEDYRNTQLSVHAWNKDIRKRPLQERENKRNQANDALKSNTSYRLNETQRGQLLEHDVNTRADAAARAATARGIDMSDIPVGVRRAVSDLNFRGGQKVVLGEGQANTEALKNKDYGKFMYETIMRSNKEVLSGVDIRNSALAKEVYDSLSDAEKQTVRERFEHEMQNDPQHAKAMQARLKRIGASLPWENASDKIQSAEAAKDLVSTASAQGKPQLETIFDRSVPQRPEIGATTPSIMPKQHQDPVKQRLQEIFDRGYSSQESQPSVLDSLQSGLTRLWQKLPHTNPTQDENVHVKSYTRDGQTVKSHSRARPNGDMSDNLSNKKNSAREGPKPSLFSIKRYRVAPA